MKRIMILSIILIILSLSACSINIDKKNKIHESEWKIITTSEDYYQKLRDKCKVNEGKDCCLSSVDEMEAKQAKIKPENGCWKWMKMNLLRCLSSYQWCEEN